MQRVVIAVLALCECAALGYLSLVTWLMAGWFLDDAVAEGMTESDWYVVAVTRAAGALVVAVIAGLVIYAINHLVARNVGRGDSLVPRVSAVIVASIIFVAGLA